VVIKDINKNIYSPKARKIKRKIRKEKNQELNNNNNNGGDGDNDNVMKESSNEDLSSTQPVESENENNNNNNNENNDNNDNNVGNASTTSSNIIKVIAGVDIIEGIIENEVFTDGISEIHYFTGKAFKREGFFSLNQIERRLH
jgi:hypothetical protein